MKQVRRWQRILILSLLSVSVFAPIVLVSNRLQSITFVGRREFIEELSNIRYGSDELRLHAIGQEEGEGLREPKLVLYRDGEFNSAVRYSSSDQSLNAKQSDEGGKTNFVLESGGNNQEGKEETAIISQRTVVSSDAKEHSLPTGIQVDKNTQFQTPLVKGDKNIRVRPQRATDEKVKEIRDKIIQAKAYINFAPPGRNSQIVKELRTRFKELERAVGDVTKDKYLSKSVLHKVKPMEAALHKASRVFDDCPAIATKLRAMTYNTEEQVRTQKNQATYLMQLAARTTPKGLHCLSMRLTAEYFALEPDKRQLPNRQNYDDPNLYHYAIFSDNVLACAVVVNSTISSSKEPERVVFHLVTDSLNYPAISMWFLLNTHGGATIQIQNIDDIPVFPSDFTQILTKQSSHDPRFTSALNHARFYLPHIFPSLDKILLFDHDVVVQRDLSALWGINMKGKVIGAVETCLKGEHSFLSMDTFINFSDAWVARKFDPSACTWAFGMNLFDLKQWRRQNLTSTYQKYLHLGTKRRLWKAGSLPIGWLTFYTQTVPLDKKWHLLGLGYESGIGRADIEEAAVIHYDGIMKPWLDIAIAKYKGYWSRHVLYDHPYLQRCNLHG